MSNGQHYAFSESDVQLAGDFTAATFTLDGELSTEVDSFTARGINYVNSKHADLSFALAINTDSLTYAFKRGKLALEELLFDVSGQVATLDDGTLCDLAIKGNGIDVERLYSLLPPEFKGQLNRYNSQGKLTLDARITGLVNAKSNPTIAADFKVKNGRLEEKTTGLTLDHLAVEGSYNQTANKSEVLNLPVIYATLKDGDVTAAVKVRDFKHPRLDVTMHGELNLADVQDFLQIDTVDQLQGRVAFDTEFKGQASALQKFDRQYFKKAKTTGRLSFQDASLRFKNQTHGFEHVQGDFVLKNNDASIEHLSLNLAGSDFQLNGLFRNFMAFIFLPNEKLTIDAGLKANQVDLDQLLAATSGESTSDEAYHFRLPDYLNFKLRTAVDHLTFRRFEANDLRGTVLLRDKQLTAKKIRFKTMDGEIRSSGTIDGRKAPNYFAYCTADFKSIDIQKLFHTFEDFGQSFLQERHLRGSSNVFAEVGLAFSDDLTVDQDRLVSNIDIDIRDGELVGLETMQAISDYMASNKLITPLVKVDEFGKKLEHIYFERMTNRIEIKKRKVTIPSMAIKSSAMNINVAGTHTFDNAIDYKFNFRLADLLRKKSLDSEFGPIEDDGLGASLFLTMKGTIDSYVIRYDRSSARENFKEKMQHEKQDIKSILKEEFHLFNKDTSVKALPAEVEKAPEFVIEWEDENTNATTDPVKDPGSSKKPKEESKDPPKKKGKFKNSSISWKKIKSKKNKLLLKLKATSRRTHEFILVEATLENHPDFNRGDYRGSLSLVLPTSLSTTFGARSKKRLRCGRLPFEKKRRITWLISNCSIG